jgi:hypothetical protein
LLGLHFVDMADVDPATDAIDVFTKQEHFLMNYSQPSGKQWNYKAYTVNPFKYPQDPRLHTLPASTFFRRIKGKPFLFLTDMYSTSLQIYRFAANTDGEIAIPAGMLVGTSGDGKKSLPGDWPPNQPQEGEWIWRDRNGDGKFDANEYEKSQDKPYLGGLWVDSKGDIWKTLRTQDGIGIRHYPVQGLDAKGNPIYTYANMQKQATPKIFAGNAGGDIRRIEYLPETDTMYLSGFTPEHPASRDDGKWFGSELVRYDNWSSGNPTQRWRITVPYDTKVSPELVTISMSVAGDYVFLVTVATAEVYVYKTETVFIK